MRDDRDPIGYITLAVMVLRAPFEFMEAQRYTWRQLDETEKNLRRVGQSFALAVFVLIAPFVLFGAHRVFTAVLHQTATIWPALAALTGVIAFCLLRGYAGARQVAGARDPLRVGGALVKLMLAVTLFVYLWRTYPWAHSSTSRIVYWSLQVLLVLALWHALDALARAVILFVGGGAAQKVIDDYLKTKNAPLRPVRDRQWWRMD